MNIALTVAAIIALATVLASLRWLRPGRPDRVLPLRRRMLLAALQIAMAPLLYWTLFPPPRVEPAQPLTVLTAMADARALADLESSGRVVALPEAPALPDIERAPDLATALRRYPNPDRLLVLGAGLTARDQAVARGHRIEFQPAPLPRGLVALHATDRVASGRLWRLSGQAEAVDGGRVELRDPGQSVVARANLDQDGRFALDTISPMPGRMLYELRLLDADQRLVEQVELPLVVEAGAASRVLLLSGGPNPELKYLRRWAVDAGLDLDSRITLSRGVRLASGAIALNAATLSAIDLLVLDERAWDEMRQAEKAALIEALDQGLGVLLRLTGQPSARTRQELEALGFAVEAAELIRGVRLPPRAGSSLGAMPEAHESGETAADPDAGRSSATGASMPETELSRRPLRVRADDAATLLIDAAGEPLALWRAQGRGRFGLWWLTDSHRLALAGDVAGHANLWSHAVTTLARARGETGPRLRGRHWRVDQRVVTCGVSERTAITGPDGMATRLIVDPALGDRSCAAYWPGRPGWHALREGGGERAFWVRAAAAAPGLTARAQREATLILAARPDTAGDRSRRDSTRPGSPPVPLPGSRWPWFLAWLALSAGLWWLERRQRPDA